MEYIYYYTKKQCVDDLTLCNREATKTIREPQRSGEPEEAGRHTSKEQTPYSLHLLNY